jgi:hypothetical protein
VHGVRRGSEGASLTEMPQVLSSTYDFLEKGNNNCFIDEQFTSFFFSKKK